MKRALLELFNEDEKPIQPRDYILRHMSQGLKINLECQNLFEELKEMEIEVSRFNAVKLNQI